MNTPKTQLTLCLLGALFLTACANQAPIEKNANYAPGLGEIMSLSSMRHAKLWFAAQAENWQLAAYEIDELKEGLEDAAKFHPTHKDIQSPLDKLIARTMDKPIADMEKAVESQNVSEFNRRFDQLTAACNACHQMTAFDFNVVTRPHFNPFANQDFSLHH